jgi:hypothetical protein
VTSPADEQTEEPDERERSERRYALGALAQSYAPRGVADLLNLTPEGRARARKNWQTQSRGARIALFLILGVQVAATSALVWGFASANRTLVLTAAGVLVALVIGTTVTTIIQGIRRPR